MIVSDLDQHDLTTLAFLVNAIVHQPEAAITLCNFILEAPRPKRDLVECIDVFKKVFSDNAFDGLNRSQKYAKLFRMSACLQGEDRTPAERFVGGILANGIPEGV